LAQLILEIVYLYRITQKIVFNNITVTKGRRDRMVVGLTTIYAISAYHH